MDDQECLRVISNDVATLKQWTISHDNLHAILIASLLAQTLSNTSKVNWVIGVGSGIVATAAIMGGIFVWLV